MGGLKGGVPGWARPYPEKDLESPSSTRLEALVPSRDSRARTRSPSPRAWRPWKRAWQPTPVFLPGEFHGQSMGSQRVGHD